MKTPAVVAVLTLMLAGCASSPAPRYHSLATEAPRAADLVSPARLQILIAAVSVPEAVDRPQLMLSGPSGALELVDGERWAEPLRRAIARALAAELMAGLDGATVWTAAATAPPRPDARVALEVLRFESHAGRESIIEAVWVVRAGASERSGRDLVRTPVVSGDFTSMVQAHRDGLRTIGRSLLSALREAPLPAR